MEVKSGYRNTDVGVIPEDWEIESFGNLFKFSNGVNADKEAYGNGLRFVNVLEPITYSHLYGSEIPGRVALCDSVAAAYAVKKGDVLFNRTSETDADLGLAATFLGTEHVVFGGFVIRGRPTNDRLDSRYSGYALRAPAIRSQITRMGQGAIRSNIGQQTLRLVIAPIPPKSEQRAIAAALSDVDALLGGLDRLIAKKRDLKRAAMQQLLTGQTRLPGFAAVSQPSQPGSFGTLPHGWEETLLASIASHVASGKSKAGALQGSYPVYGSTGIIGYTERPEYEGAAILVARVGANAGRLNLVSGKYGVTDNTIMLRLSAGCSISFVLKQLEAIRLNRLVFGSGQPLITGSQLKSLTLILPQLYEQHAIATALDEMEAELAALEARRNKTRDLKQAVMQELLTGKIRLVPPGDADA